jgi:hypothetical protein
MRNGLAVRVFISAKEKCRLVACATKKEPAVVNLFQILIRNQIGQREHSSAGYQLSPMRLSWKVTDVTAVPNAMEIEETFT